MDRRGWVVVMDWRAGMKRVVGRGSAAEVGRWSWLGRGWVVAEVAPVMIFFEWVCSSGFQIGWVSNRGWVVVMVCSGRVWVSNRLW